MDERHNDDVAQRAVAHEGVLDPVLSNAPGGLFWGLESSEVISHGAQAGWSHRRGEPRVMALMWSLYLFAASLVTVMQLPVLGMTEARFIQSSSRLLLVLLTVGVTVLWPMLRLSQVSPRRPGLATWVDLFVLLVPMQAVLWPLTWLGRWDLSVTAAVSVMIAGWAMVLGSFVCLGTMSPVGWGRSVWMSIVIVVCGAAPMVVFVLGGTGVVLSSDLALVSPWTAVFAITTGPSGLSATVTGVMWVYIASPVAVGAMMWVVVWIILGRNTGVGGGAPRMV